MRNLGVASKTHAEPTRKTCCVTLRADMPAPAGRLTWRSKGPYERPLPLMCKLGLLIVAILYIHG